ncbi:TIGR02444 family protein [Vreelandella aquamarina]
MGNSTRLTALQQDSLWDFALRFYAFPDVEAACLCLQDEGDVDICELLFHCWLMIYGIKAKPQAFVAECRERRRWQGEVTAVLRQLRQRLKGDAELAGAESGVAELRGVIKKAELMAERENLQRWQQWGQSHENILEVTLSQQRSPQEVVSWLKMCVFSSRINHISCEGSSISDEVENALSIIAYRLDRLIRAR